MNTQQNNVRRNNAGPSKMIRVVPTVTDPAMQSNKSQADMMLAEMGEAPDQVDDVIFNRKKPTKEELDQQANQQTASSDNSVVLIIITLVVVALVALIVWLLMKQGGDKKEEEEVRRMIQPHPRNGMPPMNRYPANQQEYEMQQREMQQRAYHERMQNQQRAQQKPNVANNQNPGEDSDSEEGEEDADEEPQVNDKPKKAAKGNSGKSAAKKAAVSSTGTVVGATPELKALSDKAEADVEKPSNFTRENPHPTIMKPAAISQPGDVDDIMKRTSAALMKSTSDATVKESSNSSMSDSDRALLDRIAKETDDVDDDEDSD